MRLKATGYIVVFLGIFSIGCQGETQSADTEASADAEDSGPANDGDHGPSEGGSSGEAGGRSDSLGDAASCSRYTLCTLIDGLYECDCDAGTLPVCPAGASPSLPCDHPSDVACMSCPASLGATTCACADGSGEGGGARWACLSSGFVCQ